MRVIFRSRDFASVEHRQWQGTYECLWEGAGMNKNEDIKSGPNELIWTVQGDARLFGLAAALKSRGFAVEVEQA